jgi:hypothetical protein
MNTPTPPRLETAIRAALAPLLRKEGFTGSGRRFYKSTGPWIQIVTVQGSRYGGSFAINLGLHFASAPDVAGHSPDPKKMNEAHCEFRRRLSESNADMWWKHETAQASMLAAVESAAAMYAGRGRQYFELASTALTSITPEALASGDYDLQGFGYKGSPWPSPRPNQKARRQDTRVSGFRLVRHATRRLGWLSRSRTTGTSRSMTSRTTGTPTAGH